MVKVLEKRVKELEELQKGRSSLATPTQKVITPGFERITPRGVETIAERERVVCPTCLSENFILPGVSSYTCEICEEHQVVAR